MPLFKTPFSYVTCRISSYAPYTEWEKRFLKCLLTRLHYITAVCSAVLNYARCCAKLRPGAYTERERETGPTPAVGSDGHGMSCPATRLEIHRPYAGFIMLKVT